MIVTTEKSRINPLHSGEPQGAIFALFSFSEFINDLPEVKVNELFPYADGTEIVGSLCKIEHLQQNLEQAMLWNSENKLKEKIQIRFFLEKKNKGTECNLFLTRTKRYKTKKKRCKRFWNLFPQNLSCDVHLDTPIEMGNQKLYHPRRPIPITAKKKNLNKKYVLSVLFYVSNVQKCV